MPPASFLRRGKAKSLIVWSCGLLLYLTLVVKTKYNLCIKTLNVYFVGRIFYLLSKFLVYTIFVNLSMFLSILDTNSFVFEKKSSEKFFPKKVISWYVKTPDT